MSVLANKNEGQNNEAHEAGKGFSANMRSPEETPRTSQDFRSTRYSGMPILSKGNASDSVVRFVDAAKKTLEVNRTRINMGQRATWEAIAVSSQDTSFVLDGAVIIGRLGDDTTILTLLFTGGQAMKKMTYGESRDEVQYSTVPSDQFCAGFKENVNVVLAERVPNMMGTTVNHIGVLPVVDAKVSDEMIASLVDTSISQTYSFMETLVAKRELNINALELDTHELIANIGFHNEEPTNPLFNSPERADISISVDLVESNRRGRDRDRQAQNALQVRRDLNAASINAYIDLYLVGNNSERRSSRFGRREETFDPRTYGENLIITELNHPSTTGHMVLALAQLSVMMNSSVMLNGLRPGGRNQSLRTYAAMGYELPDDQIETEIPENLTDKEWGALVDELVYPEKQILTIQIPRAGLSTVSHSLLSSACDPDNPYRDDAADAIIDAADRVTDGNFSKMFDNDAQMRNIGELVSRPVLLGYWTDATGQMRDLREIDYFAILAHYGKREPKVVSDFDRCLYDFAMPIEIRLARMEEIIRDFTGGSYKILDRADNIELNTDGWLYRLTDACRKAGMVVSTEGIVQDTSAYRRGYEGRYQSSDYEGSAFSIRRQNSGYGFGR